jgi:hypothetical protein
MERPAAVAAEIGAMLDDALLGEGIPAREFPLTPAG